MKTTLKGLVWLYLVLLIFEGALRKWVLPGLSEPLLIIRDPVVFAIYLCAFQVGFFPLNRWLYAIAVLAVLSVLVSLLGGCTHPLVIAYGLRINYFHLPLIWIMPAVLDRDDVVRMGRFLLLLAIPMTALMVEQFRSPGDAWINKGVGESEGLGQLFGADGRIRPPGFFSFITGPSYFFPLCAAFFLNELTEKQRLYIPLLGACGLCILIALPISISRTVMLATALVGLVYLGCLPLTRPDPLKIITPAIILGALALIVTRLPVFEEGMAVFGIRWTEAAASSEGDGWANVSGRTLNTFSNPLEYLLNAPLLGQGIGLGSNVGARLVGGNMGFLLGEEEYQKIFGELGLIVGSGFILLRIGITATLVNASLRALFDKKDCLPPMLLALASHLMLLGQWAPPTNLGFTVLSAGLLFASKNTPTKSVSGEIPPPKPSVKTSLCAAPPSSSRRPPVNLR